MSQSTLAQQSEDHCYALALSGGGSIGSYEAGVLWGLVNNGKEGDYAWDVVSGVSAGAINAFGVSLFHTGDEIEMVQWLSDTWAGLQDSDVYVDWRGGILAGLTMHDGIYDDDALQAMLQHFYDEFGGPYRKVTVSAVDVNTAAYVPFGNDTPASDWAQAVRSSASIPGVFPPQHMEDKILMDGGTVWNTNLISAIDHCMELVGDESKITLDIAVCGSYYLNDMDDDKKAIGNLMRKNEIKDYYKGMSDIQEFKQAHPDVNYRHYVQPSGKVAGGMDILSFDNSTVTWPMQMLGRKDGKAAVELGNEVFTLFDYWTEDQNLQT